METRRLAGISLSVVGLVGYGVGVATPYPGRALSLTAIMLGVGIAAIAGSRVEP